MRRTGVKTSKDASVKDDYLDLIRSFPLRIITSDHDFRVAGDILDRFIGREDLTAGQRDYLGALSKLMEDYQSSGRPKFLRKLSPVEVLRYLMEQNDMTAADLGYVLGSRGLASEVLNGNRGLSKTLIARLSERFKVEPGVFFGSGE